MEDEYRGDVAGRWNRRFLFDSLEDEKQRIIAEAERLLQTVERFEVTEPYGYVFQHEETGLQQVVDAQHVEWGFEKNNPRWQKICPVFARPQSAAVMDGWQPIETAPTDGSRILITDRNGVKIVWWGAAAYNRKSKSYDRGWTNGAVYGFVPTHWMPLPASPALHSTQEG
jgi:hypothetical protein